MQNAKVGAAILAGGKSSRMGQDKALIRAGQESLLERTARVLRPLATEIVIVANPERRYEIPGCRVVGDVMPDCGPVAGILTALRTLREGWHIVVACDMPNLETNGLAALAAMQAEDYDAVIPISEGRLHPLCALYRSNCIQAFDAYLLAGGRSVQGALRTIATLAWQTTPTSSLPDRCLVNLNSRNDYERWLAEQGADSSPQITNTGQNLL